MVERTYFDSDLEHVDVEVDDSSNNNNASIQGVGKTSSSSKLEAASAPATAKAPASNTKSDGPSALRQLCAHPQLALYEVVLSLCWMLYVFTYYGIGFSVENLNKHTDDENESRDSG